MKKWSLIWLLLTERGFVWKLEGVIRYALMSHDKVRGHNSSDVIWINPYMKDLFTPETLANIRNDTKNFWYPAMDKGEKQ